MLIHSTTSSAPSRLESGADLKSASSRSRQVLEVSFEELLKIQVVQCMRSASA